MTDMTQLYRKLESDFVEWIKLSDLSSSEDQDCVMDDGGTVTRLSSFSRKALQTIKRLSAYAENLGCFCSIGFHRGYVILFVRRSFRWATAYVAVDGLVHRFEDLGRARHLELFAGEEKT